jgi:hypothetical protein
MNVPSPWGELLHAIRWYWQYSPRKYTLSTLLLSTFVIAEVASAIRVGNTLGLPSYYMGLMLAQALEAVFVYMFWGLNFEEWPRNITYKRPRLAGATLTVAITSAGALALLLFINMMKEP